MATITFDTEWHDGAGIKGAELSATFASLRIRIDDQPVTRVLDSRARTVRDSVYVPLYPLAEWLVANWWFLACEFDNPTKAADHDFRRRHALGTHTEGYALPDLRIVPTGTHTFLEWSRRTSTSSKIDFLENGRASVEVVTFQEASSDLIERVIRRLRDFDIHDTFLQTEWESIQGADVEEATFLETAAGLGWDPYDLDEDQQGQVARLAQELGPLCSEAASIMDASRLLDESSKIVAALETARTTEKNRLQLQSLGPILEARGSTGSYPWRVGWVLARQARQRLKLDGQPVPTLESLAEALGIDGEALEQATQPMSALDGFRLMDGVVAEGPRGTISLGLRGKSEQGRRFAFCRALAEVMTSGGDALLTGGVTDRQRSNRAFAAEFLAPASGLRQRISEPVVDPDEVDELAEEFGVSTLVIVHQIENQGIAQLAEA